MAHLRTLIDRGVRAYRRAYRSWALAKQRLVPSERQRLFGLTIAIGGVCGLAAVAAGEPVLHSGLVNAADLMRPVIALRDHDSLRTAYDRLLSAGLRELPVVDAGGRVVGLVGEPAIAHAYLQARRARAPGEPSTLLPDGRQH